MKIRDVKTDSRFPISISTLDNSASPDLAVRGRDSQLSRVGNEACEKKERDGEEMRQEFGPHSIVYDYYEK